MHTVHIRVADGQGGYIVEFHLDHGGAAWNPTLKASEQLPADLGPGSLPSSLGPGPPQQAVMDFVRDNDQSPLFGTVGDWLARLLFRGSVAEAWDKEDAIGDVFRTLIEVDSVNLVNLPWELMRRNDIRLFTNDARPFARMRSLDPDTAQELVPLRLLVVEGTRDNALDTAAELGGITSALPAFGGRVEAEFLTEPSQNQLWKAFEKRPHIFHFVGHGLIDGYTKQPSLLIGNWLLTRDHILNVMRHPPRLAVLNACRSGEGDVDQVQALTGAFLNRKVAAVIGIHGDVRGKPAALFGVELYKAIADGRLIDEAVTLARQRVFGEFGVVGQQRDWALPSLSLRVRPEQVLPLTCGAGLTKADLERIKTHLFKPTMLFVDRTEERSDLVSAVDPDTGEPKRLLVVLGGMQVGKTWLVNWVRTRCALRGRRVRYVDFRGLRNLGFLQALNVIRDTAEDVASLAPSRNAYDRYDYDLRFLLKGKIAPEPQLPGPGPVKRPPIPDQLSLGENIVDRIFDSYRTALERESSERPLLLIFDHVTGVYRDDFLNYLYPLLIKKIGDGEVQNVRLLVVLSAEQRRDYWPPDEAKIWSEVPVDLIDPGRYEELAREIIHLLGTELNQDHLKLISLIRRIKITDRWSPAALKTVVEVVAE
jgi:hypothetical protein